MRARRPAARDQGFTLIEALIAMALVALGVVMAMSISWQLPRIAEHSRTKALSYRALGATLDTVRTRQLPLRDGEVLDFTQLADIWTFDDPDDDEQPPQETDEGDSPESDPGPTSEDMRATMRVFAEEPDGLYRVQVTIHYRVRERSLTTTGETLVWRP